MPAPKGNKFAVGNKGKPKQWDVEAEAKDLLEWSKSPEALVLRKHGPLRGYSSDTMHRWAEENEVYRQAYNQAKDIIGARREEILILNSSASPFQRYASWYDKQLRDHEKEKADEDAARKKQENDTSAEALKDFVKHLAKDVKK